MEPIVSIGISITAILLLMLIARRFGLPIIIGVLVAGMLVGPYSPLQGIEFGGFSTNSFIITDVSIVEVFATIGAALILFEIGLEFSILSLAKLGLSAFIGTAIKMSLVIGTTYAAASLFGFSPAASFVLGIILSMSSTPIVMRLLEENGKLKRPETQLMTAILIIEDLVLVFVLGVFSDLVGSVTQAALVFSIFKVIVTFVFAYIIFSRFVRWFLGLVSSHDDMLVLAVVSLVLVISYASQLIGLSFSVGAFLAGSVIAGSASAKKISGIISPFNTVFASMFFLSIGMLIDPYFVLAAPALVLALLLIAVVVKFAGSALAAYLLGANGRSACFSAAALLVLSEGSLLIAKQATASGVLGPEIMSIAAGILVITALLASVLMPLESELYSSMLSLYPKPLLESGRAIKKTGQNVSSAFGSQFKYANVLSRLPAISFGNRQHAHRLDERLSSSINRGALFLALTLISLFLLVAAQLGNGFFSSISIYLSVVFVLSSLLFVLSFRSALEVISASLMGGEHLVGLMLFKNVLSFMLLLSISAAYVAVYLFVPQSFGALPAVLCAIFSFSYFFRAAHYLVLLVKRLTYKA